MITVEVIIDSNFSKGTYHIIESGVIKHSSKEFDKATTNTLTFIGLVHALMIEHRTRDWREVCTDIELMRYLINDKKHFREEVLYGVDINHYIGRCNRWLVLQKSHNEVSLVDASKVVKANLTKVAEVNTNQNKTENNESGETVWYDR